jgi:hypothetical protein
MRIRCGHASTVALSTNRNFCELDWVRQSARQLANDMLKRDGDAGGLLDLAPVEARELLLPALPMIVKTQKSSGLWRIKNARGISFCLLRSLAHAGLLDALVPQLRHDPYRPFREADDWHGIAVRKQLLKEPLADEPAVTDRLLKEMANRQCDDGSWEHTVIATLHHLAILGETGLSGTSPHERGIAYLFACFQPQLRRDGVVVARDMITSHDAAAEDCSAMKYNPQWIPYGTCFSHLPMIQTGFALRRLNKAGYQDDPRVLRACQNLVELRERFGGWCQSNIREGLLAEAKRDRVRMRLQAKSTIRKKTKGR